MTWLIWRQHRTEVCVLGLLVGMFGIALLVLGTQAHDLFPGGPARCAGGAGINEDCAASFRRLDEEYGYVENLLAGFYLVPVVIGAFLGAPLLARELEGGTWQLAWTQAVPRMRWLAAKLAALAGVTGALTGLFSAVLTWFRQPFDAWEGRFQYDAFDLEGLVPVAYALFAFGVATAAGAILRRSLPRSASRSGRSSPPGCRWRCWPVPRTPPRSPPWSRSESAARRTRRGTGPCPAALT